MIEKVGMRCVLECEREVMVESEKSPGAMTTNYLRES
jgi:hypothetical protein